MTMLQVFVQVVSVALGLCKQNTILNRMVKAAQLGWVAFLIKFLKLILTHTDTCTIITSSGERFHHLVEQKDLDSNSNPIT